jgi:hypothetical protein
VVVRKPIFFLFRALGGVWVALDWQRCELCCCPQRHGWQPPPICDLPCYGPTPPETCPHSSVWGESGITEVPIIVVCSAGVSEYSNNDPLVGWQRVMAPGQRLAVDQSQFPPTDDVLALRFSILLPSIATMGGVREWQDQCKLMACICQAFLVQDRCFAPPSPPLFVLRTDPSSSNAVRNERRWIAGNAQDVGLGPLARTRRSLCQQNPYFFCWCHPYRSKTSSTAFLSSPETPWR